MRPTPFGLIVAASIVIALLAFLTRSARRADQPSSTTRIASASPQLEQAGDRALHRLTQPTSTERQRADRPAASGHASAAVTPVPPMRRNEPPGIPPARSQPPPTVLSWASLPNDIPTLSKIALEDSDPERRLIAVSLLSTSEDPQVIPILVQALADENEDVRMAAVESLSDFTGEAPADAIESALNDPSADIRYEALSVLGDVGGERARNAIQRALNDPDPDVRGLAQDMYDIDRRPADTPAP